MKTSRFWKCGADIAAALLVCFIVCAGCPSTSNPPDVSTSKSVVVIGYNDLGMHCMNQDFSELMILPPSNTLHAQVIERGGEAPRLLASGVTVSYSIASNTTSSDKTNFWTYVEPLMGVQLAPDIGLAGKGLSGQMDPTGENDWFARGIPITPLEDDGSENPYPLATITVERDAGVVADTMAVVPISWEINCDLCHTTEGISVATDILRKHDTRYGTTLEASKPVLCAGCHADPALGLDGGAGVSSLSHAMHGSHASRMEAAGMDNVCYACHPGQRTQCLRDVHFIAGMTCTDCHISMEAVAEASRRPWVDLPRCDGCHGRENWTFEQADTLYRNSVGHGNVHCEACHGSPHAILPTTDPADNVQSVQLQGHSGPIDTCTVCHTSTPDEGFFHHSGGEGD